ncbi:MAG: hypothetical protein ABFR65_07215 [Pseudomonadota bacterium]
MKSLTYLSVTALILALSVGLSIAGNSKHHKDWDSLEIDGLAEPLLGLTYSGDGLEFRVPSTGCTEKSHFVMQRLSPESQITSQLLLIRVVPDFCDAYVPFGTRIFYGYEELGLEEGDPFTILNPLSNYRVRSAF